MKRFLLLAILLCAACAPLFCQDIYEPDDESERDYSFMMNQAGDQFIRITLNAAYPIEPENLELGGMGTLGYHRFLTSWLMVGLDVSFGYNPTIGSNVFNYIPFIFSATFQPTLGSFEFPISLGVGFAVENYLSMTYFPGLILKPQVGVFYRINNSWSVGLQGDYTFMPQWFNSNSEYNRYGHFIDCGAGVRYHF